MWASDHSSRSVDFHQSRMRQSDQCSHRGKPRASRPRLVGRPQSGRRPAGWPASTTKQKEATPMNRSRRPALVEPGVPFPLGSKPVYDGVNFSVYSRHALGAELLLYDDADASEPSRVIVLDVRLNRTWNYWHVFVAGLRPGQLYAYRVHGPVRPGARAPLRPRARCCSTPTAARWPSRRTGGAMPAHGVGGRNDAHACKSVVADDQAYDWEGRPAAAPALCADRHLRDARARLHAAPLARACRRRGAAASPAWWTRSPTCSTSASPRSS
jgi:hypothetical protein